LAIEIGILNLDLFQEDSIPVPITQVGEAGQIQHFQVVVAGDSYRSVPGPRKRGSVDGMDGFIFQPFSHCPGFFPAEVVQWNIF
jgi:hypothetical protein